MNFNETLKSIPRLDQRQDSTMDQLRDLRAVANKLGMYDAADVIGTILVRNNIPQLLVPRQEAAHCAETVYAAAPVEGGLL